MEFKGTSLGQEHIHKILQHTLLMALSYQTSGSNSNCPLKQTLIFEWCVIICEFRNTYQKDMCLTKIGLRIQNYVNYLRDSSEHLMSKIMFTLIMYTIFI